MCRKSLGIMAVCFGFTAIIGCTESVDSSARTETVSDLNAEVTAAPAIEGEPVNRQCPITGNQVAAAGGKVEYRGMVIGFCGPECSDKWNALQEGEREIHYHSIKQVLERNKK